MAVSARSQTENLQLCVLLIAGNLLLVQQLALEDSSLWQ